MNAQRQSSRASAGLLILLLTVVAACNTNQPSTTVVPTTAPTTAPTQAAKVAPPTAPTTAAPTTAPTIAPAAKATDAPKAAPTTAPTTAPTAAAKAAPTQAPPTTLPPTTVPPTTAPTAIPATAVPPTAAAPAAPAAPAKLNLNTTPGNDFLTKIPGFSARMVREFEEYRPYVSIQQFRREIGKYVNAQVVAEYEKYVFVPINRNQADAPTLQQIPGLDANEAAQLIAARPFASNDAFLEQVAKLVSADELAIARTYLSTP